MASNTSWAKIFEDNRVLEHDFSTAPFYLGADDIKRSVQDFKRTAEKEVRILCKMDTRESLPDVMRDNELFLLPVNNGRYALVKGEGYLDIPDIPGEAENYESKLPFPLLSSEIGDSEMQHLDFAYAVSIVRTFMDDPSLVLTIRGRKYTPEFTFRVGEQEITANGVQTEVDAGYEGENQLVLIEAKNSQTTNTIIRQLYYPYRQWKKRTGKNVSTLFFEKREGEYLVWEYLFTNEHNYNSIQLKRAKKYRISNNDGD